MLETYKSMKELANLYGGPTENEEAVMLYQKNEDAVILAYLFTRNFGMIYGETNRYFNLTDSDKASITLQELDKAMHDYQRDKGAKFTTFFSRYLNRRMYSETSMLNHQVRKANLNTEDFMGTTFITQGKKEQGYYSTELLEILEKENFTEREKNYCKIVIEDSDVPRDSDVAKILGISSAGVKYIKESLQKKFTALALVY